MEKLYHYTSFDTFLRIWVSKRLKFASVKNVNDIEEGRCDFTLPCCGETFIPLCLAFEDVRASYKQISLTMDYDNTKGCMSPIMWAHYGDKRKGVCIELDYKRMNIPSNCFAEKVVYKESINKYREFPIGVETISGIRNYIIDNRKDIFFTKLKCWEAENEYRIISDSDDYLYINNAITGIYLTSCESDECKMIESMVKSNDIKVRYIHSRSRKGVFELCDNDTSTYRQHYKIERNRDIYKATREFYEARKNNENASLIWKEENKL